MCQSGMLVVIIALVCHCGIQLVEFDEPTTLLNNPDSFFSGLVDQSGDQREALRALVFEAARKKGRHVEADVQLR